MIRESMFSQSILPGPVGQSVTDHPTAGTGDPGTGIGGRGGRVDGIHPSLVGTNHRESERTRVVNLMTDSLSSSLLSLCPRSSGRNATASVALVHGPSRRGLGREAPEPAPRTNPPPINLIFTDTKYSTYPSAWVLG